MAVQSPAPPSPATNSEYAMRMSLIWDIWELVHTMRMVVNDGARIVNRDSPITHRDLAGGGGKEGKFSCGAKLII